MPWLFLVATEMPSLSSNGWRSFPLKTRRPAHAAPVAPLQQDFITLWLSMAPFIEVSFMTLCSQSRGPDIDLHQRVPCRPTSPLLCCGRPRWTQRGDYKPVYPFFLGSLPIYTCLLVGIFEKVLRTRRQVGNWWPSTEPIADFPREGNLATGNWLFGSFKKRRPNKQVYSEAKRPHIGAFTP